MSRDTSLSLSQQLELSRELARLVRARLPLETALAQLSREDQSDRGRAATEVNEQLTSGKPLAQALASGASRSSQMLAAAIELGQSHGRLDEALESWTSLYASLGRMQQRLLVASVYPILLMLLTIVSLTLTAWHLIPHYENAFLILADEPPVWLGALSWVKRHLVLLVAALVLAVCTPLIAWWLRRRGVTSSGVYRDKASRAYLHAHVARLALVAVRSGQAIVDLLPMLERAAGLPLKVAESRLGASALERSRLSGVLLGRETTMILSSLESGLLSPEKGETLLESVATQTKRYADEQADRQTRWLPIFVALIVGTVTVLTYVALIYGPWVILFYEIVDVNKL